MKLAVRELDSRQRRAFAGGTLLCVLLLGLGDRLSGNVLSFTLLYALPLGVAAWFVSARYAFALSLFSVALWAVGDLATRVPWDNLLVPFWNGTVRLFCYSVLVAAVSGLHQLQRSLEARVAERTSALTRQIAERERLERELLAISEREQRRFGQDLHDSLCQHLTGTALAGKVLAKKLAAKDLPEARDAEQVVRLIEAAIAQSRSLARAMSPLDLHAGVLSEALEELAATTTELFRVSCTLVCAAPAPTPDAEAAAQLYRIAQEAVSNAIKHGRADRIVITLKPYPDGTMLCVEDNGIGLPELLPRSNGMGLRIMSHRANRVGARFEVMRRDTGGTLVNCFLPRESKNLEHVNA